MASLTSCWRRHSAFAGQRGAVVYDDHRRCQLPLCPLYFFINAQGRMLYIAEQIGGGGGFVMLQRRNFYSKKNAFFVAMRDFGRLVPVNALVI